MKLGTAAAKSEASLAMMITRAYVGSLGTGTVRRQAVKGSMAVTTQLGRVGSVACVERTVLISVGTSFWN